MTKKYSYIYALLLFAAAIAFNSLVMGSKFVYPFTNIKKPPLTQFAVMDLAGYLLGARRLMADISWIQTLQYYGTPEEKFDKEDEYRETLQYIKSLFGLDNKHDHGHEGSEEQAHDGKASHDHHHHHDMEGGVYPLLSEYSFRTAYLDPFFDYSYLFSAGSLAWNLNRPDDAIALLQYGVNVLEPFKDMFPNDTFAPYWRYNLYISAIVYKKGGKFKEMTALLEKAVELPQAPNMVKMILANIYEKDGNYLPALKLWVEVLDSNDTSNEERAKAKISKLRAILGI